MVLHSLHTLSEVVRVKFANVKFKPVIVTGYGMRETSTMRVEDFVALLGVLYVCTFLSASAKKFGLSVS